MIPNVCNGEVDAEECKEKRIDWIGGSDGVDDVAARVVVEVVAGDTVAVVPWRACCCRCESQTFVVGGLAL